MNDIFLHVVAWAVPLSVVAAIIYVVLLIARTVIAENVLVRRVAADPLRRLAALESYQALRQQPLDGRELERAQTILLRSASESGTGDEKLLRPNLTDTSALNRLRYVMKILQKIDRYVGEASRGLGPTTDSEAVEGAVRATRRVRRESSQLLMWLYIRNLLEATGNPDAARESTKLFISEEPEQRVVDLQEWLKARGEDQAASEVAAVFYEQDA